MGFCRLSNLPAVPARERTLYLFASYLSEEGLKHRTIKVYLSAVRFLHISEGAKDPFAKDHHHLHYILQGIN